MQLQKNAVLGTCSYCKEQDVNIIDSQKLIKFSGDRLIKSLYSIDEASNYEAGMFFEGCDDRPFEELSNIIECLEVGDDDFEYELADYVWENSDSKSDLFILDDGLHDNNSYKSKWASFTKSIAHKHRFFNKESKVFLDALFDLIIEDGEIRDSVVTT
ncbi:MAG: hypothetical protein HRU40_22150, partial [Saprospiraceae bacterium]|nr:hypothetical protein [Saprospiraceae bacterium]